MQQRLLTDNSAGNRVQNSQYQQALSPNKKLTFKTSNEQLTSLISECDDQFLKMNQQYQHEDVNQQRYQAPIEEDSHMTSISPDNKAHQNIDEETKSLHGSSSANKEDQNYDFLAHTSLMESQASYVTNKVPGSGNFDKLLEQRLQHDSEMRQQVQRQPTKHNFKMNVNVVQDDLSQYLMNTEAPPFKDITLREDEGMEIHLIEGGTNNASPDGNAVDEEQLQNQCNQMRYNITALNLPDPGNLRTNKKKDVRARLKCLNALIKQRQKDLEIKSQSDNKMSRFTQDFDVFQERLQRANQKILDLEREKNALNVQLQNKDKEVKHSLEQQKTMSKSQTGNNIKLEQKASKLQCELKKRDGEVLKLQDQIKRLMGIDKYHYQNSIDLSSKATNGQLISKNVTEAEFAQILKGGTEQIIAKLQQENENLKDCLILVQNELKIAIDGQIQAIQSLVTNQSAQTGQVVAPLLNDLSIRYGLQERSMINQLALNLPQNQFTMQQTCRVLQENVRKVKSYYQEVLTPISVIQLVKDLNTWIMDSQRAKGVQPTQVPQIVTIEDLRKFIKANKCTCELINLQEQQRQSNFIPQSLVNQVNTSQQMERRINHQNPNQGKSTSLTRKKWGAQPEGTQQPQQLQMNLIDMRKE